MAEKKDLYITGNFTLMTSDEVSADLCIKKSKPFEVYKHAIGGVLGDKGGQGWTGKVGNHTLLDFIIFKCLFTSNLHILAKITKT